MTWCISCIPQGAGPFEHILRLQQLLLFFFSDVTTGSALPTPLPFSESVRTRTRCRQPTHGAQRAWLACDLLDRASEPRAGTPGRK